MWMIVGGGCLGVVVLVVVAFFVSEAAAKKRGQEALAACGAVLGTWTVFYDVKQNRVGLAASFGELQLVRYLLFRMHDLFEYNQGLEAERRRIGELFISAARGLEGEAWTFLFQPPKGECYHSSESPNGTLFKYFEGKLYENAIDMPRFLGGDSIAKQKGLEGECIAIIQHLGRDPSHGKKLSEAVVRMVEKELREGRPGAGAAFWKLPTETLREVEA